MVVSNIFYVHAYSGKIPILANIFFSTRLVQPPLRCNLSSFYNSCLSLVSFPVQVLHWIGEVEGDRFTRTSPERVEGSYFE